MHTSHIQTHNHTMAAVDTTSCETFDAKVVVATRVFQTLVVNDVVVGSVDRILTNALDKGWITQGGVPGLLEFVQLPCFEPTIPQGKPLFAFFVESVVKFRDALVSREKAEKAQKADVAVEAACYHSWCRLGAACEQVEELGHNIYMEVSSPAYSPTSPYFSPTSPPYRPQYPDASEYGDDVTTTSGEKSDGGEEAGEN
jgi:hypothetical protein